MRKNLCYAVSFTLAVYYMIALIPISFLIGTQYSGSYIAQLHSTSVDVWPNAGTIFF